MFIFIIIIFLTFFDSFDIHVCNTDTETINFSFVLFLVDPENAFMCNYMSFSIEWNIQGVNG
jgi:hypothetical protein